MEIEEEMLWKARWESKPMTKKIGQNNIEYYNKECIRKKPHWVEQVNQIGKEVKF